MGKLSYGDWAWHTVVKAVDSADEAGLADSGVFCVNLHAVGNGVESNAHSTKVITD